MGLGSFMLKDLMLVGSIPFDTAQDVFRAIGPRLGNHLSFIPDGEIGERLYWVNNLAYRVFHGHPQIETVQRPLTEDGVEHWHGEGDRGLLQFRIKQGVNKVIFGDPGWRLGYARDAIHSYFVFKTMRSEGVLPAEIRFQVCLPLPASGCYRFLADKKDYPLMRDGLVEALRLELDTILENIPGRDLAIQWDCAIENDIIESKLGEQGELTAEVLILADEIFVPAEELNSKIPEDVTIGYHACYGTSGGWPRRTPNDLTGVVVLCNAAVKNTRRRVDFLHLPTVGSSEPEYFSPLSNLKNEGARIYMGLIHANHEDGGMGNQMKSVQKYLPEFGIAAPCGFGRGPGKMSSLKGLETAGEYMEDLIDRHLHALKLLQEVRGTKN